MKLNKVVENVGDFFGKIFSKNKVNVSAIKTKFTERKRGKLDGYSFLVAMTLGRFKKSGEYFELNYFIRRVSFIEVWIPPTI